MKLWTSGEIMSDVGESFRFARKVIEEAVNERLEILSLKTDFEKWAFIGIILSDKGPDYKEIKRRSLKRKVLEFRLKIDHGKFLHSTPEQQKELILEQLKRSVSFMPKLGICEEDCKKLIEMLDTV